MTQAAELKMSRSDGKARQNNVPRVRQGHGGHDISQPTTILAARMLMGVDVAIKALALACEFDLINFAALGKQLKITVDRAQADTRQALAHYSI